MARDALIKARAMESDIREADLTKERLKLERAIRKVEAEELEGNPAKKALIHLARHIEDVLSDFAFVRWPGMTRKQMGIGKLKIIVLLHLLTEPFEPRPRAHIQ
jgi:hypothetical protein